MCDYFGTTLVNFNFFFPHCFCTWRSEDEEGNSQVTQRHRHGDLENLLAETLIFEWGLIQNIQWNWPSFQMLAFSVYDCRGTPFHCWTTNLHTVFSWLSKTQLNCIEWLKAHRTSNFEECPGCLGNIQVSIAGQPLYFRGLVNKLE